MSFVERAITLTITTAAPGDGGNVATGQYVLSDYRIECFIEISGGNAMGVCQARIYGLPLKTINQLTAIGPIHTQLQRVNTIAIIAGDVGSALSTVYQGHIATAMGQFQSAPDVVLNLAAYSGYDSLLQPALTSTYKGSVDAATLMAQLAKAAGYGFQNDGVSVQISNPHVTGTILEQIRKINEMSGTRFLLDKGILYIWPKTGHRSGPVSVVSPDNGLVGYPEFWSKGVTIKTQFMPDVLPGGQLQVSGSSIPMANGTWNIYQVQHEISAQVPNGPWFTNILLFRQTT